MKNIAGSIAVVTGAGSGIGRATALALAGQGARVAVTDVAGDSADKTVEAIRRDGGEAWAFRLDVSDPGQAGDAATAIAESLGVPAVLVNNAGIAVGGLFLDSSPESWDRIVAVNLMGVVNCCRAFLPRMVESGRPGHVVNIASMLGYTALRGVSAYCATKHGVVGFSECLRAELWDHGIGVSTVCPGFINTNIIRAGILESSDEDVEARRAQLDAFFQRRSHSPDKVAQAVLSAIRRNRSVVPVTPEAWAAWYSKRWAPWLVARLARRRLA